MNTHSSLQIGLLGTGVIGSSWAALFLARGHQLTAFDPSPESTEKTKAYIVKAWQQLQQIGAVVDGVNPDAIRFVPNPEDAVEGADFIQENVPERLPVKIETYQRIEPHLKDNAIVATSASGLLLKEMQNGWKDPSRFLLGHPFNPPHLIPLVELLGNKHTDPAILDRAAEFYESCGKVTIRVKKEVPAHVANRLQAALWREAIHLVAEGVASVEDVDKAVTAGPGLRWSVMGPHMLFGLGSGGGGIEEFCKRYGDSFDRWWDSLGAPQLDDDLIKRLAEGLADEEKGRSFEHLSALRDKRLIAVLRAFTEAG
jgi:3-hydroxybutyryl-CoA dehydrogenase